MTGWPFIKIVFCSCKKNYASDKAANCVTDLYRQLYCQADILKVHPNVPIFPFCWIQVHVEHIYTQNDVWTELKCFFFVLL